MHTAYIIAPSLLPVVFRAIPQERRDSEAFLLVRVVDGADRSLVEGANAPRTVSGHREPPHLLRPFGFAGGTCPRHARDAAAFGQYRAAPGGGHRAWVLNVLELSDGRIARTTFFLDVETLFPAFGLPLELPA